MADFYTRLSEKTGLSEEIVKRVIKEAEKMIASDLAETDGDMVQFPGLGSLYYKKNLKLGLDGNMHQSISVRIKASATLNKAVEKALEKKDESDVADASYLLNYAEDDKVKGFVPASDPRYVTDQIEALR